MEIKKGKGVVLEIDVTTAVATTTRGVEANFFPVVCLTENGFSMSRAEETTSNKCDGDWATSTSGLGSWSMTLTGQIMKLTTDEATTRKNSAILKDIAKSGAIIYARETDVINSPETYNEGKVRISEYSEDFPNEGPATFSITFTGVGEPFFTPTA